MERLNDIKGELLMIWGKQDNHVPTEDRMDIHKKLFQKQHPKKLVNIHLIKAQWGQKLRLPVPLLNAQDRER